MKRPAMTAAKRPGSQQSCLKFFAKLVWLDGSPLLDHIEGYRRKILRDVLDSVDASGRVRFNLALLGRAKKNWKTTDLVLAALYRLLGYDSPGGNQCYILANDEDQAADDLTLAKKIIGVNPLLAERLVVKQKTIERADGKGFLQILPAGDIVGAHGKTYCFLGYDEIHGQTSYDLFEAMAPDPTRKDVQVWITSYASIHHRPGIPLYDLFTRGQQGLDPKMYFSWFAGDYCTDPDALAGTPEERANPSLASFDPEYLAQQQLRLPAHKYRRLHLNLPGAPEGAAFQPESVMDAIERGVRQRPYIPGMKYVAFCDHSHGSGDDTTLGLGHEEGTRHIVDLVVKQRQAPPFNMVEVIPHFAALLKEYRVSSVTGDSVGGETYRNEWLKVGIQYRTVKETTSELYEAIEPALNGHRVVLPDIPLLEQQLLGLVWKGGKITHPAGQHDDFVTAAAGVVRLLEGTGHFPPIVASYTESTAERAEAFWMRRQNPNTYYTPQPPPGEPPTPAPRKTCPHGIDVMNNEHRSVCRKAREIFRTMPEMAAPTLINADQGTHWVTGPSGKGEIYVDKRGLGPEEPYEECQICGRKYPESMRAQHQGESPRCRPEDEYAAWKPEGWSIAPDPNNPERVLFMHTACGFNGNSTRATLQALHDRHMRERH